jgi:hypothetical protein
MNRFLLACSLATTIAAGLDDRVSAQSPSNGYTWSRDYYIPPHSYNGSQTSSSAAVPPQPGSIEYAIRERAWEANNQHNFPNSPYGYYGWSMPGSVYNNPYSLYGAAASVPTLYNPLFVVGNYGVTPVRRNTPNIYAPYQYDYQPYPRR